MKIVIAFLLLASCDRLLHRGAPDAGEIVSPTPTPTSNSSLTPTPSETATGLGLHLDEEEEPTVPDAGTCPLAIHPFYCRFNCRSWINRKYSLHARRITNPTRAGVGTCDAYNVFAEDDAKGGIVEYYDDTNQLVGATDSRQKPCGTYGKVPKCKLDVKWGAPHTGSLRDIGIK